MSSAPSQDRTLKRLTNELQKCDKLYGNGRLPVSAAYGSANLDVSKVMGAAGLDVYSSLHECGGKTVTRVAAMLICHGILVRRRPHTALAVTSRNNNGRPHQLAASLEETRGLQWFTITSSQERDINQYMGFQNGETAGEWFRVKEISPGPGQDGATAESSCREPTRYETVEAAGIFQCTLRGVSWRALHEPPRVTPGNLVPGDFLNYPNVSGGTNLNAKATPISMLGQGCAQEAEAIARRTEDGLRHLRYMVAQRDDPLQDLGRLSKDDLVKRIQQHRAHIRDMETEIDHMINDARQSDRVRVQRWQILFSQVSNDQAHNRRPGLWSPDQPGQANELRRLEPSVQSAIPPLSIPQSALPLPVPQNQFAQFPPSGSAAQPLTRHPPHPQLPSYGSHPRLPGPPSQPSLAAPSSRVSTVQPQPPQQPRCEEPQRAWMGTRESIQNLADPFSTPTARRHGTVGPIRNLPPAAGQPARSWEILSCDDEEDDGISWSHQRPDPSQSARRKRESQGGGSAHGRPHKFPCKGSCS